MTGLNDSTERVIANIEFVNNIDKGFSTRSVSPRLNR